MSAKRKSSPALRRSGSITPLRRPDHLIVDNLTTAVLVLDLEFRVRSLNPAAEALLDVSANQVGGMDVRQLLPEAKFFLAALSRIAAAGYPLTERDMQLVLPNAAVITVDCVMTPVSEPAASAGILVEFLDLDRHKQISREEQLMSQNESARALVRGLAHEIRNPLGGLRGAAQLLDRELESEELKEYTRIIVHEADRLQTLLDRLLGPRTRLRKRAMNIHEVTEHVRALVEAEAPAGVVVDRDYDPSIPELDADPELLIQAALNVVKNAVQAVDGAGRILIKTRIHRQYTIGLRRHRLVVRVDVSDNGPGIPEQLKALIFYPMVTGRSDGTGLGLSIAQSLVNQHGGLIECHSEPGNTTFSILLPVGNGAENGNQAQISSSGPSQT
jgi:two-component system nitrogen regulation sensor histidine kinase GlnL